MAADALTTGARSRAPGKIDHVSACSRRALIGAALAIAAVPAAAMPSAGWSDKQAVDWIGRWLVAGNQVQLAPDGQLWCWRPMDYDFAEDERTSGWLEDRLRAEQGAAAVKRALVKRGRRVTVYGEAWDVAVMARESEVLA